MALIVWLISQRYKKSIRLGIKSMKSINSSKVNKVNEIK